MKGRNQFTSTEISQLEKLIQLRSKASSSEQKSIRNQMRKIGFYGRDDFGILDLQLNDLRKLIQIGKIKVTDKPYSGIQNKAENAVVTKTQKTIVDKNRDEDYVLNLCDKILKLKSSRQHKFDFLVGDSNRKLPVDSYYDQISLVIEYRELQHTESVSFFDKVNKVTVSGVHRGEQRKLYDQRRRDILPKYKIELIEISYSDFVHDKRKRIIRNIERDEQVLRKILSKFIK